MNDESENPIPEATVSRSGGGAWVIWLIPLTALLIGAWLVYQSWSEQGPVVTIRFADASGIEPRKTRIKLREVDVGVVEDVQFSNDLKSVVVTGSLQKNLAHVLTDSTRFWVVRPRIGSAGVSGLGTLVSGGYIAMDPGEGGQRQRDFVGLDEPPSLVSGNPGTAYTLVAKGLGSLTIGSKVYFRQIPVGEVTAYRLTDDRSSVEVDIFVFSPNDASIRRATRFWNSSGVNLNLDAQGLRLEVESLAALATGGISFDTPAEAKDFPRARQGSVFTLYKSEADSREASINVSLPYLLYFQDTVRGLSVGAPVEFRGIRVGSVTRIRIRHLADSDRVEIPVQIELEPDRIPIAGDYTISDGERLERLNEITEKLVAKGLRAQLQTGNLLTGSLYVEFDLYPDAPPARIRKEGAISVLPTRPNTLASITTSVRNVLTRLEEFPIKRIGDDIGKSVAGLNSLINDPALGKAIGELSSASAELKKLIASLDREAAPMLRSFDGVAGDARKTVNQARNAMVQAEKTLAALQGLVGEDSPVRSRLVETLEELSGAARSIRLVADYLERYPEALIRGKSPN
ncbi:MAG: MCE family protein [Chromatiales bacterium]|nr:MCE family protein [Chromatiales bacterium]